MSEKLVPKPDKTRIAESEEESRRMTADMLGIDYDTMDEITNKVDQYLNR